jgi:hypothetical protein
MRRTMTAPPPHASRPAGLGEQSPEHSHCAARRAPRARAARSRGLLAGLGRSSTQYLEEKWRCLCQEDE